MGEQKRPYDPTALKTEFAQEMIADLMPERERRRPTSPNNDLRKDYQQVEKTPGENQPKS